ncbi:CX domain-containing protein [Caenorhabditis elegans]|uniref:CX domain-containing protein n=1 Tax=Caenorhabditis elegans TaxID=6239 RepID=Q20149_CAEEL|nr:CX domain-containing protein [Caenorhabditis elegans]CAA98470.1 CX domain-containing protein [Caenorhabditis elegans]|eukprot:NP_505928.1 Uncharacterized protein CELE_F38B7.2 [Caenorhabditis elegans]
MHVSKIQNFYSNLVLEIKIFRDISTNFYPRFVKTVFAEESHNFDVIENKTGKFYFIHPDTPIEFEKYKYYWNESHADLKGVKNLCEYRINWMIDSKEMYETFSPENTQMKSLFYRCHFAQTCMGLECKIDSRLFVPPIFLLIFISIFWCFKRMLRRDMKRVERQTSFHIMDPTNPAHRSPPPPYNAQNSAIPPPYHNARHGRVSRSNSHSRSRSNSRS